jgi:hypothetical protein
LQQRSKSTPPPCWTGRHPFAFAAWICCYSDGKAAAKIVPPRLRTTSWTGLGAESEEKREPASDIEAALVDSLKVLDPERPIREADIKTGWMSDIS